MEPGQPKSEPRPIWRRKVDHSVWLRLPIGMSPEGLIIYLVAGVMIGIEMVASLLAGDRYRWVCEVGLVAAALQIALAISSLWARHVPKR
jgi:hypothetical protein